MGENPLHDLLSTENGVDTLYYQSDKVTLFFSNCLDMMKDMPADSVDAIVTDPPYGLEFMGKGWDHGVPGVAFWREALRVAKPGAHILAFGGTRTFHRLAVAIEDAGWQIRDTIGWLYGSGFPKSMDISKAIDKQAGATPIDLGVSPNWRESKRDREKDGGMEVRGENAGRLTAPATDAAKSWSGWGTALKPAWEPIILARKPIVGTVANNVLQHGTGGINVDGCRVQHNEDLSTSSDGHALDTNEQGWGFKAVSRGNQGRFPANIIHDGSDEVTEVFSNDSARFFYQAKASKQDRDEGLDGFEAKRSGSMQGNIDDGNFLTGSGNPRRSTRCNDHPTVKPTALMRYLCKLITPPDGVILDPFMGSGSTGKAAVLEGFRFIGIDLEIEYVKIAKARILYGLDPKTALNELLK